MKMWWRNSDRSTIWGLRERIKFVNSVLGSGTTARLLHVSKNQLRRWKSGAEVPEPVVAERIIGLDYVLARSLLVWDVGVVYYWLTGPNPHLGGSSPFDVLSIRGAMEVIEALEAEVAGAYA